MSTFSELQCFNKLLLQKMEKMQKKMEKLETKNLYLSNQEKEYSSLINCVDLDDVEKCWECKLWHERCYMYQIGDTDVCESCYNKKNYFECQNCGEHYIENQEEKKMEDNYGEIVCNRCYKGYILLGILDQFDDGYVYNSLIDDMVDDKNKVLKELLEKVKIN